MLHLARMRNELSHLRRVESAVLAFRVSLQMLARNAVELLIRHKEYENKKISGDRNLNHSCLPSFSQSDYPMRSVLTSIEQLFLGALIERLRGVCDLGNL